MRFEVLTAVSMKINFFRNCPEDGGRKFLRNVGDNMPDYAASHSRRQ
jgi:hypothetical protein